MMVLDFAASRMALLGLVMMVVIIAGYGVAHAEVQTLPTADGTLDVRLEYDDAILPGEEMQFKVDFLNPLTGNLQEHIDYTISVTQDDKRVFGPTNLIHTSPGTITVPIQFQREGVYLMEFSVQGILFNPIPSELVSFDIIVASEDGTDTANGPTPAPVALIPDWIKTSAGWWADGTIDDATFIRSLEYLIENGILVVPSTHDGSGQPSDDDAAPAEIPSWIKTNAGWWADGTIDDNTFVAALQYLIATNILQV